MPADTDLDEDELDHEAERDARTLTEAKAVLSDPERLKRAKAFVRRMSRAVVDADEQEGETDA